MNEKKSPGGLGADHRQPTPFLYRGEHSDAAVSAPAAVNAALEVLVEPVRSVAGGDFGREAISLREELRIARSELHALRAELEISRVAEAAAYEELRSAKEHWERTFDAVPDLIAILDDQHRIVRVNRAMTDRLGVSPEDCQSLFCYHCVHGTDGPPEDCPHARTMVDGGRHELELRGQKLNGDFLVTTSPILDKSGKKVGSVHVARDISERKRAEESLKKSKEQVEKHLAQLQAILDHLNDGVVIADPQGNLLHWNPAALAMYGFQDLDQVRCHLQEFEGVMELSTREQGVLTVEQWPLPRILRGETLRDWEVTVRHRLDGWQRVFSYGGTQVRDKEGTALWAVLSITDITLRMRAEESLRQSEAQFRTLADAMPQLCWIAETDGRVSWYNRRWYEYTGTTAEEMADSAWESLHDPQLYPLVMERWHDSLSTGTPFDMTFPLRGADGVFRSFLTRCVPILDEAGRVVRWFGTNTDISERSKIEQALHRSNLRLNLLAEIAGELLANVSPQLLVNSICRRVMEFLDCQSFFNFLVDEEQGRLHLNACAGVDDEQARRLEWLDFGDSICGCAARDASRIVAQDLQLSTDPITELAKSCGMHAYACHPLVAQGRVLGTLSFGTCTRTSFTEEEVALMNGVADLVAIALERKLMEESLRQSEAVLEAFFDASPGILNIQDEQLRYLKTDRLTPSAFGLERKSIVGKTAAGLAPGLNGQHDDIMRRVMETGRAELNREVSSPVPSCTGGAAYWLASYFPVPLPGGRRGVGVMGVDITDKKEAEEELRRAHDQLEHRVQERTEELACAVETLLGEISDREKAEAALRRLNRLHKVLSEIDQAIVRAADRESLFRDFCRIAVEEGGFLLAWVGLVDQQSGEVRVQAGSGATAYLEQIRVTVREEPEGLGPTGSALRDGTYFICNDFQHDPRTSCWQERGRPFGIRASASIAVREEDRVVGALTLYAGEKDFFDEQQEALLRQMGTDISYALGNLSREAKRREAEQALQQETLERLSAVEALREQERLLIQQSRQAAMGEMIGNIAHQWRQPLNTVGLMVQELGLRYDYGDFNREYLAETVDGVMRQVNHMSQTIDDFRNFFRPEKEKMEFRARKVIARAISMVEASLAAQRIRLEFSVEADPVINGYPNEYSQVILNILLNCRDVLTERPVEEPLIEVRLQEERGRTMVTIADNAGGIPAEILDRIFEPYFTTKGPDKGTGIGLYMSKVIIEKNMNGRLSACNDGKGAVFTIEV